MDILPFYLSNIIKIQNYYYFKDKDAKFLEILKPQEIKTKIGKELEIYAITTLLLKH